MLSISSVLAALTVLLVVAFLVVGSRRGDPNG